MMVSTKGRYALRVILDIALNSQNQFISLKSIADRQEISIKYLESIVAILCKADILDSQRGKKGGYRLKKSPCDYTVGSIVKLTEGSLAPVACLSCSANSCSRTVHCLTLPMWQKLNRTIDDYLENVTIQDLLDGKC